jgi:hypothetical protein
MKGCWLRFWRVSLGGRFQFVIVIIFLKVHVSFLIIYGNLTSRKLEDFSCYILLEFSICFCCSGLKDILPTFVPQCP